MAHKVIVPPKKNYIPQFLKQRDINSYSPFLFTVNSPTCKNGLKLVCNVNILHENLISENSQKLCTETSTKLFVHESSIGTCTKNLLHCRSNPKKVERAKACWVRNLVIIYLFDGQIILEEWSACICATANPFAFWTFTFC